MYNVRVHIYVCPAYVTYGIKCITRTLPVRSFTCTFVHVTRFHVYLSFTSRSQLYIRVLRWTARFRKATVYVGKSRLTEHVRAKFSL